MSSSSNPKRDQILRTGKDLFWKFGFKRVTIEEICKEAGVSKMTYYKYFANKMELVRTIMDNMLEGAFDKYRTFMNSDLPYPEKVTKLIELKQEQTESMSNEFLRDYMQSAEPDMVEYLEKMTRKSMQMFRDDFEKAQQEGNIRKDLKVDFILYMINQLLEMTHDENLLAIYPNPRELATEMVTFMFYGILNRDLHP